MSDFLSVLYYFIFSRNYFDLCSLPKESKKSSFGNISFIHNKLAEIFSRRGEAAFDCIFANSLMPIFRDFFKFALSKKISRIPV